MTYNEIIDYLINNGFNRYLNKADRFSRKELFVELYPNKQQAIIQRKGGITKLRNFSHLQVIDFA